MSIVFDYLRSINYSYSRVSSLILEGVRQFALTKGAIRIIVTDPIGKMKEILTKSGFNLKYMDYGITGQVGNLTLRSRITKCNCYLNDKLTKFADIDFKLLE